MKRSFTVFAVILIMLSSHLAYSASEQSEANTARTAANEGKSLPGSSSFDSITSALLLAPSNGSIGVVPNPALSWMDFGFSQNYWVQLSNDSSFATTIISDSILAFQYQVPQGILDTLTVYYWRVASESGGVWGPFTAAWNFKTMGVPFPVILFNPPNNSIDQPVSLNFSWYPAAEMTSKPGAQKSTKKINKVNGKDNINSDNINSIDLYWFELTTDTITLANLIIDSTLTDTTKALGGLSGSTVYYWRVKAHNQAGWGAFSDRWNFTTVFLPPAPSLVSPVNGAIGVTLTPLLKWMDFSIVSMYRVQVSNDSLFGKIIIEDSLLALQDQVSQGVLSPLTYYYWRVASKNGNGWGAYSVPWKFKTIGLPLPVSLSYPPNNSVNIPINLTFSWFPAAEMMRPFSGKTNAGGKIKNSKDNINAIDVYWFELVTDTVSLAGMVNDSTVADTTKSLNGLTYDTNYYWRVKAHNEVGWGSFSGWWNFRTTPAPPAAPILISPANQASNIFVTPLLDWSDVNTATLYEVQVSAFSSFSTLWIDDSTSTISQFQVPPGYLAYNSAYYWRVRAKNTGGWGSYQSPFRFFTLVTPPPPAPSLISPPNGAIGISLTPALDWSDVSGSVNYHLQLSADSTFATSLIDDSTLTNSQYSVSSGILSSLVKYYWRVATKNNTMWGSFSNAWNFKTVGLPLTVTLFSPVNDSVELPVNLTCVWYKATEMMLRPGTQPKTKTETNKNISTDKNKTGIKTGVNTITAYWFELVTDTVSMAGLIKDTTVTDTTKAVSGLTMAVNYFWHVKANNENGWGPFSAWWGFTTTTGLPPSPPVLISPSNMATGIPVTPLLDWSDVGGATKYRVQVSAFSSFSTLWLDDSSSTISQFQVSMGVLAYNSGYFWRVKAKNGSGWGNFQSPFRFFTQLVPPSPPPVLLSPSNGAAGIQLTPTLDWSDVSGAAKYRVQVSLNSNFAVNIIDDSSSVVSQYTIGSGILSSGTIYYWRAAVESNSEWSSFTGAWNFKTINQPSNIILYRPAKDTTEQPVNLTFSWFKALETMLKAAPQKNKTAGVTKNIKNAPDNISAYWFELVTDTTSLAGLIRDTTLIDTTKSLNGLSGASAYYWRVKATNELGWGSFTSWWKFSTVSGLPPSAPVLLSPAYHASEIPVTPLFDWSDVAGATKYRIQVSAFSNFSTLWIDDSSSTTSQFQTPMGYLAYNSVYYWRVKAENAAGWGNYQSPFLFFTQVTPPLAPPALVSPSNGATGVSLTPVLDWNDVSGSTKFRVQLSFDSVFTSNVIDDSSSTLSQFTVPSSILLHDTVYYWRVAVKNTTTWSSFTAAWNFRTAGILTPPSLLTPANKDTGISETPLMDWSDVTGAASYRLQVSAFSNFSVLWVDAYTPGSSYQVPPGVLAYNSRYYWRVKSLNSSDSSGYSNAPYFFTKIFPYSADEITSVRENKITLSLSKMNMGKSDNYSIEICKDTLFTSLVWSAEDIHSDSLSIPIDKLENYSTYFWRLKASDTKTKYSFTPVKVFVTGLIKENLNGNENTVQIPVKFALYQNYPNPFNPTTNIKYDLPKDGQVSIKIYDILGKEVFSMNEFKKAGAYNFSFNASNLSSDEYFYRIESGSFTETKKMILVK